MRFSLAALFAALTIGSLLLAYGTASVRARRQALHDLRRDAGASWVSTEELREELAGFADFPPELRPNGSVPWWRELLGDEAIETIYFTPERRPTADERERIARLFPEAEIVQQEYPPSVAY